MSIPAEMGNILLPGVRTERDTFMLHLRGTLVSYFDDTSGILVNQRYLCSVRSLLESGTVF